MKRIFWALFLLLTFLITLPAGWWVLAKVDFAYGILHDHAGIKENIEHYAPHNDTKKDFAITTRIERISLFHGIVKSIENHGDGLVTLSYHDRNNQRIPLLTQAEITHLKDVATLLDNATIIAGGLVLLWIIIVIVLHYRKIALPHSRDMVLNTAIMLLIIAGMLLLGPEKIFNQLHIWIFPKNHQWFFYYEESLMSTMMKAPDLFAYIAAMWFAISMLLTVIIWTALKKIMIK